MVSTAPTLETLKEVLRRFLPTGYHALLFGSRATGTAQPNSDWDIGILGPAELPLAAAGDLREAFEELPTLHTIEIVDLTTVPETFRAVALRKTIPLI